MKKSQQLILATVILAAGAFSFSCKKTIEPGPAGADGKNGNTLLYKQEGTTLQLSGIYSSDGSAFDNTYKLSYFASLDENSVSEETIDVQPQMRTEAPETSYFYHIVRRDSSNNSVLSFDIVFYYGSSEPKLENLNIDIITNITSTGYKRIATGYVYNPSVSGNTSANGFFDKSSLGNYELSNVDNTLAFSNWNYNQTTKALSFEFSGVLVDYYNSTRNPLAITAKVAANLNNETHRVGKE